MLPSEVRWAARVVHPARFLSAVDNRETVVIAFSSAEVGWADTVIIGRPGFGASVRENNSMTIHEAVSCLIKGYLASRTPSLPARMSFENAVRLLRSLMARFSEREAYEMLLERSLRQHGLCQEVRSRHWLRSFDWNELVTKGASKALSSESLAALLMSSDALLSLQELLQDLWLRLDEGESVDLAAEWQQVFCRDTPQSVD